MKYAFFGSPEFAAIILERLIGADMPPALLVCNPDRPVGRKKILTAPAAKQSVLAQDESVRERIEVAQPEKPKEIEEMLRKGNFDLFIVAAYGNIIPKSVLSIPRLGTVGVHPSLLPKFRGATPIQSALISGEEQTGVSLFVVDEKVDHGAILNMETLEESLHAMNYATLHDALARLGADMLIKTLPRIERALEDALPQNESAATFTKKFESQDGFVDEKDLEAATSGANKAKAIELDRKIRALNPEPGVYTIKDGVRTKLLEADIIDGKLVLRVIQVAGKTPKAL